MDKLMGVSEALFLVATNPDLPMELRYAAAREMLVRRKPKLQRLSRVIELRRPEWARDKEKLRLPEVDTAAMAVLLRTEARRMLKKTYGGAGGCNAR